MKPRKESEKSQHMASSSTGYLGRRPSVKVMDFGASRAISGTQSVSASLALLTIQANLFELWG